MRILLLLGVLLSCALAQAQEVQLFHPTPGPYGLFTREQAQVGDNIEPYGALWTSYARAPLQRFVRDSLTGNLRLSEETIAHQVAMDAVVALGLFKWVEIGLGAPFIVFQSGAGVPATFGSPAVALAAIAFGDLRAQAKLAFLKTEYFNLATSVLVTFPSGNEQSLAGEATVTGTPRLIADVRGAGGNLIIGADIGVRLRGLTALQNLSFTHELVFGTQISYAFWEKRITVGFEMFGNAGFRFRALEETPIEALGGAKLHLGWFTLSAGGGTGVTTGYGTPRYRVFLGLAIHPQFPERPAASAPVAALPPASAPLPAPAPEPEPAPEPAPSPASEPVVAASEPAAPMVQITKTKIAISETVEFETKSAKIQPKSFALLDEVARVIKENPRIKKIRIDGHTDQVGKDGFNMKLSDKRAKSVQKYLEKKGISPKRMSSKGFGFRKPRASNITARGRALNRRVEFIILKQTGADDAPDDASFDEDAWVDR